MTEASNPEPPVAAPAPVTAPAPVPPVAAAPRGIGLFDPATRRQTVIVAVVLAAMFFGTQVLNEALPASATQGEIVAAPGDAVQIGGGWRITPLDGWVATPHDNGSGIRLEKGVVVVDLFSEAFDNAGDLARAYLEEALQGTARQITATDIETAVADNGTAARFTYQGIFGQDDGAVEGEVTAIVTGRKGVIADAWSPQGDLVQLIDEVHQMLDTIDVAP